MLTWVEYGEDGSPTLARSGLVWSGRGSGGLVGSWARGLLGMGLRPTAAAKPSFYCGPELLIKCRFLNSLRIWPNLLIEFITGL